MLNFGRLRCPLRDLDRTVGERHRIGDGFRGLLDLGYLENFYGRGMYGIVQRGFLETAGDVPERIVQREIKEAVGHQERQKQKGSELMQVYLQVAIHRGIPP